MDFDTFWSIWPSPKKGKAMAKKAWAKVPEADYDAVVTALQKQKTSDTRFLTYTPHPATWLNQCRWEDDIDDKPSASNRGRNDRSSTHYTPSQHEGQCTFTYNGRRCPLPGNLLEGPSTASAPWFCQWHSRPANRGYGAEQEDFFSLYGQPELAADYVKLHYGHDVDAIRMAIVDDNPQWLRLPSEGRTAYRDRMRQECHDLLNRFRDKNRISNKA